MDSIPVTKNQQVQVQIENVGLNGNGVGRVNDYVIFIPGALPGETVLTHIMKVTPRYAVGKLVQVESPSADRVLPSCPLYGKCGGCSLQHMSYPAQLQVKQQEVLNLMRRVGKVDDVSFEPIIPAERPLSYRNKGSFPFGVSDDRPAFGFFAPRSHRLVPMETCCIEKPEILSAARAVQEWAKSYHVSVYREDLHSGCLRYVSARVSNTGGLMVTVVTKGPLPHQDGLVRLLRAQLPNLTGIMHNRNDARTNVILGLEFNLIWGEEHLSETICGLHFTVHSASFLQVNAEQTDNLYQAALQYLSPSSDEIICDLYCGIGTITLLIALQAKKVYGVEIVPAAIENARQNAVINGIRNAEFLCAPAEEALPRLLKDGIAPDAVVVDPPRKGLEKAVLDAILQSSARRLVYISCNPATLARDCAYLAQGGFAVQKIQPVDMFPMTSHVETVCLLYHEKKDFISVPYEP